MPNRPLLLYATDAELYEALRRRTDRAYAFLYAESYPPFQYWVLTNNGSEMDAEDSFQKGMLSFMLNLETGKYQLQAGTRITTVLFEYCKRVWLTELGSARLRTRTAMPDGLKPADTTDVTKDLERLDIVDAVRQSLGKLKGDCRQIVEWFYVEELSLRDIADRLNMKESSVKSKRYQCTEKLKEFYQQAANRRL